MITTGSEMLNNLDKQTKKVLCLWCSLYFCSWAPGWSEVSEAVRWHSSSCVDVQRLQLLPKNHYSDLDEKRERN